VISGTTFSKWGAGLAEATEGGTELVLTGVSTDCCVLSTALAAADAGAHVRVVADACAGLSEADHQRALAAMALYQPFLEIVTVADVLAEAAR
jgi:nicotinamidase-related amidase